MFSPLFFLTTSCNMQDICSPDQGIDPLPPEMEAQSPEHQTVREVPWMCLEDQAMGILMDWI